MKNLMDLCPKCHGRMRVGLCPCAHCQSLGFVLSHEAILEQAISLCLICLAKGDVQQGQKFLEDALESTKDSQ